MSHCGDSCVYVKAGDEENTEYCFGQSDTGERTACHSSLPSLGQLMKFSTELYREVETPLRLHLLVDNNTPPSNETTLPAEQTTLQPDEIPVRIKGDPVLKLKHNLTKQELPTKIEKTEKKNKTQKKDEEKQYSSSGEEIVELDIQPSTPHPDCVKDIDRSKSKNQKPKQLNIKVSVEEAAVAKKNKKDKPKNDEEDKPTGEEAAPVPHNPQAKVTYHYYEDPVPVQCNGAGEYTPVRIEKTINNDEPAPVKIKRSSGEEPIKVKKKSSNSKGNGK